MKLHNGKVITIDIVDNKYNYVNNNVDNNFPFMPLNYYPNRFNPLDYKNNIMNPLYNILNTINSHYLDDTFNKIKLIYEFSIYVYKMLLYHDEQFITFNDNNKLLTCALIKLSECILHNSTSCEISTLNNVYIIPLYKELIKIKNNKLLNDI